MKHKIISLTLAALLVCIGLPAIAETAATDAAPDDKAELAEIYPAEYTDIVTEYSVDKATLGNILYAAEGVTEEGREIVALKIKGAKKVSGRGSANTGWDDAMPDSYTIAIIIDKAESAIVAWKVLVDGTTQPEYFTVPDELIDAYVGVPITEETAFDEYTGGLVFKQDYEKESSEDGPLITGTTIVYTGATQSGSFSSQLVRNCFRAAAYFYVNYAK
ncbi:MAG: hypothetical protein LBD16_04320 [Oscillospiraceae bacterium]|jgi:hypothetical protein|nr:hypothetical protein [Oscillospiraceae bacterium]